MQTIFPPPRRVMKAFTLVEFLVIFVIFFGLASLFLPHSCRSRENARRASCQSNLKQIGLALVQYTQDYNETYPLWQHNPATDWAATILPYTKAVQIYQCPSETTSSNTDTHSTGFCDYFYNANLGPQTGGRRMEQLTNPAMTIVTGDAVSSASNNSSSGGAITLAGSSPIDGKKGGGALAQGQWSPKGGGIRHLEGGNYSFADGHVKWLRADKVTRNPVSNQPTFRWTDQTPPVSSS